MELGLGDEWLQAVTYVEVGPEGERIDKDQYVSDWQSTIQSRMADDSVLRKVRDDERLAPEEEDDLVRRLNRPERYFNEENLRRAYRDPDATLADNDYNLTASRYKPRVAEAVPDEDPAELIREVLAIEREITVGLEKLLGEVE